MKADTVATLKIDVHTVVTATFEVTEMNELTHDYDNDYSTGKLRSTSPIMESSLSSLVSRCSR